MNLDPRYLVFTSILTLVVSHFGANYLKDVTPRGYWFWFTLLNIIVGLFFL